MISTKNVYCSISVSPEKEISASRDLGQFLGYSAASNSSSRLKPNDEYSVWSFNEYSAAIYVDKRERKSILMNT